MKAVKKLAHIDFVLLVCVLVLLIIGTMMVYTSSSYRAEMNYGDSEHFLTRQLVRLVLGIAAMLLFALIDYRRWLVYAPLFYVVSLALLVVLFTSMPFVSPVHGSRRWIQLGFFSFQPSDLARYALILVLARALYSERDSLDDFWRGFGKMLVISLVIIAPILVEPDLGTAVILLMVVYAMFFFAEVRITYLLASGLTLVSFALFFIKLHRYQSTRIDSWIVGLNTGQAGWQVKQSLISLAEGGWFGNGLGNSRQKYMFLPEAHKDFIFSIVGEEMGFIGTVVVLFLFLVIIYRGMRIAIQAPNGYGRLLAAGLTVSLGLYAFINAGVAVGVLPTTGIPMPFVSYGGTALVMNLAAIGLLMNIALQGSRSNANAVAWRTYRQRLNRPIFTR
ncbi:MAG TPA: putative lipid II flippase FtsW [bacterium]|nr:putative lipid II flippase FtsW [bacterium]